MVHAHRSSLTGLYPGFSAAGTFDNGSFVAGCDSPLADCGSGLRRDRRAALPCDQSGHATAAYAWASAFIPLGLTVEPVVDVSPVALVAGTADRAIPAMVTCAIETNITGYMVDFESFAGATIPHGAGAPEEAAIYTSWLKKLGAALHAAGKTLAVCSDDYGMMGEYASGFATPEIDTVMSMATYYNMANSSSHASIGPLTKWSDKRQLWEAWLLTPQTAGWPTAAGVSPDVLSAGIGTVTTAGCGCRNGSRGCCDHIPSPLTDKAPAAQPMNFLPECHALGAPGNCFFWTEPDLREFVQWCDSVARIRNVDVYRADFNANSSAMRRTAPFFFSVLSEFLAR